MTFNLSIRQKIQTYILGAVILVYIAVFGYISLTNRSSALDQTSKIIDSYAEKSAGDIGAILNSKMAALRVLASTSSIDRNFTIEQFLPIKNQMVKDAFLADTSLFSYWDSWEYSYIKPGWDKEYGREAYTVFKENGVVKDAVTERSLDGDPYPYSYGKALKKEFAFEPYMDLFAQGKSEARMMTSLATPFFRNGKYAGIFAEDVTLDQFEELLLKIKPFDEARTMLVSQKGIVAGYTDKKMLNRSVDAIIGDYAKENPILDSINLGKKFSFVCTDSLGHKLYYSFAPIRIGKDNACVWSLGISVPVDVIYAQANRDFLFSILVGLIGLIIIWIVTIVLSHSITGPVNTITSLLSRMAEGDVNEKMKVKIDSNDELGEMGLALNRTIDSLVGKEEFASQIGKGNLNVELNLIGKNDRLGNALVQMQADLTRARSEEELRKIQDDKVRWASEGISRVNDIIHANQDLEVLSKSLVKEVVGYVKAEQGGLFLLNDEDAADIKYDLMAAYAYNRQRMLKKSIRVGEGVIGTCIAEKEEIYLRELPNEFVEITSGLGGANPNNVFIVPFVHEQTVLGVMEIISFKILEDYEREFILKVAENIASAISFAKNNETTRILLEQSKAQTEIMSSQDEEMRQNLEELRATQEESYRQHMELSSVLDAFGQAVLWVEYDLDGNVLKTGGDATITKGVELPAVGDCIFRNAEYAGVTSESIPQIWDSVTRGSAKRMVNQRNVGGRTKTYVDCYLPVEIKGMTTKVLQVSIDISENLN